MDPLQDPVKQIRIRADDILFTKLADPSDFPPDNLTEEDRAEMLQHKTLELERMFKRARAAVMEGPFNEMNVERSTAATKKQAATAKELLAQAQKYNPDCRLTCRRALLKVTRATEILINCGKTDRRLHEVYFNCLALTMELIIVFEMVMDDWGKKCRCQEYMTEEEFAADDLHGANIGSSSSSSSSDTMHTAE